MRRMRKKPVMQDRLGTWPLGNVARLLNSEPSPLRDEVRALFARYRDSGPNLQRMMDADKKLARQLRDMFEVRLVFTSSGFADLQLLPRSLKDHAEYTTQYQAAQIFGRLILNKDWAKLDGPCSWCGEYFVRERRWFRTKEHVYCSREHSRAATATESMQEKRDKDRDDKLQRLREASQEWENLPESKKKRESRKDYVCRKTGISKWSFTLTEKRTLAGKN